MFCLFRYHHLSIRSPHLVYRRVPLNTFTVTSTEFHKRQVVAILNVVSKPAYLCERGPVAPGLVVIDAWAGSVAELNADTIPTRILCLKVGYAVQDVIANALMVEKRYQHTRFIEPGLRDDRGIHRIVVYDNGVGLCHRNLFITSLGDDRPQFWRVLQSGVIGAVVPRMVQHRLIQVA